MEKYDNLNLNNANEVVSLWSSLEVNTADTNGSGNYVFNKNYDNVGETIKVYVNNPYSTYRTFKVKGNVPNGCSKIDNDTKIECPKSACLNKSESSYVFNFEEIPPPTVNTVPNATIKDVVDLTYGQTLSWTVEATDADGNLQSSGIYIHSGTPPLGEPNGWTVLKWVGGQNKPAMTFKHSDDDGVIPWTCNAKNQDTWTLITNAADTAGLKCSGNPVGAVPRCALGMS